MRMSFLSGLALLTAAAGATLMMAQQSPERGVLPQGRPQGSCDIYAAAGDPCVAAHSTTRALYAAYSGPLYQVLRQSDVKTLDVGVVAATGEPVPDSGGYADAAAQDRFCAGTYCWISKIYDQSPEHNDLIQAPRGGFSGPALGGFNTLPLADMAPMTIMRHKVYGVFIEPGMGLRQNDVKGTAVDDQAEGQYWVVSGKHFNAGCCFDYGNAEIDSRDDDNGTMETLYFGNARPWYSGAGNGPWIMTDQENNLVGCVNDDGTKGCPDLPSIPWRFVTAIGKGEPHHWTSMGGDSQKGALSVMFDGHRVNPTYDPMRKQGAILLGNGGDNSVGSQGTFYEGAMTAAGTFPSNATDQLVQANIVAAGYDVTPLSLTPAATERTHGGQLTFTPGSSREFTLTFTNTSGSTAADVSLSVGVPGSQWTAVVSGTTQTSKKFAQVDPGASVSATFKVTSARAAFNGDLAGHASWMDRTSGRSKVETAVEKIRNSSPVKINEFRVNSGAPGNPTDTFIELYNAGSQSIDLSDWTLTAHPVHQAIFSTIRIPRGTKLASGGFYLLGLSNSGLVVPAHAGESTIHVRNSDGMAVGDTINVGSGSSMETRKLARLGTATSSPTTLWQSIPDEIMISIPLGSTNVPVEDTSGFVVGEKIALGYGSTYPIVANTEEQYEVATVTAVGKPGTQAYLAMEAPAGSTKIQVTSLANISAGDKIRLDIDSLGHGIETVTIARAGTAASQTNLSAPANAGATRISVRKAERFAAGNKIMIGTPASQQAVTIIAVGAEQGSGGIPIDFTPALARAHAASEWVVSPGTGLDLVAPLRFTHAANLPFSDRGTGITFQPATAFAHSSNEPVQALGTGLTLDRALTKNQAIHAPVRDAAVVTAGYQGMPAPNQWFGGPELTTKSPQFGATLNVEEGSIILREPSGVVADSLNYGGLVDPWAAEGDQTVSGTPISGCYSPAPGSVFNPWSTVVAPVAINMSAGRFPDGADTDSNCADFSLQAAASLSAKSDAGATNIKVASTEGFRPGQTIYVDSGLDAETAVIAAVGTAGATTVLTTIDRGATLLPVTSATGFAKGQTITIDEGPNAETAVVLSSRSRGVASIAVVTPLARSHARGAQISGSGISLATPLARTHLIGAQVFDNIPTPGAPNRYEVRSRSLE